jgi:Spy/CpxP family protein refolding chaperone
MKTTWIVAAVLAMGISFHHLGSAHAQVHGGPSQSTVYGDVNNLVKVVNATPEQTRKLKALHQQVMSKVNALKTRRDLNEGGLKVEYEKLHKDAFTQLQKILTPEQLKKLMAHNGMKGPGGQGHFSPMAILDKLDLSVQQKTRIKQIMANIEQDILDIKNDGSLSPVEKEIKAKELHEQSLKEINSVLTPEQSRKAHEMMREHHEGHGVKNPPPAKA